MSKAKVLVITSGKGGVGKTTSTAALGAALAQAGQNVVVVDFDVGLRIPDGPGWKSRRMHAWLTFSILSTFLPLRDSRTAMCVMG